MIKLACQEEAEEVATVDMATPIMVAVAKAEATVALILTSQPNKDCVLLLVKAHLIMGTRQQLMR